MIRIALVEDNPDLRDEIVFHLGRLGHDVVGLPDGQALDRHLAAQEVDVLVLDVGLPGENGFSIAGRMRTAHPMLGIAMLTARGQVLETQLRAIDLDAQRAALRLRLSTLIAE